MINKYLLSLFFLPHLVAARYYSQYDQDKFLHEEIFRGKQDGVFVEVGASDGITLSNSLFFEKLGWTGLCIEPRPKAFEKMVKLRKCACLEGCVSNFNGEVEFLDIEGYGQGLSGIVAKYDPKHVDRINTTVAQHNSIKRVIKVKVFRFSEVLAAHNINFIDYLSIDTEGGELDILDDLDFSKVHIKVIGIEANYDSKATFAFLEKRGFKCIKRLGVDLIFINTTLVSN